MAPRYRQDRSCITGHEIRANHRLDEHFAQQGKFLSGENGRNFLKALGEMGKRYGPK